MLVLYSIIVYGLRYFRKRGSRVLLILISYLHHPKTVYNNVHVYLYLSHNWVAYHTLTARHMSLACICIKYTYRFIKTPPTAGRILLITVDGCWMNLRCPQNAYCSRIPILYWLTLCELYIYLRGLFSRISFEQYIINPFSVSINTWKAGAYLQVQNLNV